MLNTRIPHIYTWFYWRWYQWINFNSQSKPSANQLTVCRSIHCKFSLNVTLPLFLIYFQEQKCKFQLHSNNNCNLGFRMPLKTLVKCDLVILASKSRNARLSYSTLYNVAISIAVFVFALHCRPAVCDNCLSKTLIDFNMVSNV